MTNEDPRLKRIFPKQSIVAYSRGKNLRDLLVKAKVCTRRKSNRVTNGFFKCGRGFFQQCVTCASIPTYGIKTHKCNHTNEIYQINSHVTCISENVIYRITCKKPQCKGFVYIGQTKRRFCDRIAEHRGYISQKKLEQVCGNHFNKNGHSQDDMLPIVLEKVSPRNDEFLRLKREEFWIRTYQSVEYGENKYS